MAKSNMRKALAARNGERFSVIATVKRFGSRRGWQGRDEPTVLLVDLFDAIEATKLVRERVSRRSRKRMGCAAAFDRLASG